MIQSNNPIYLSKISTDPKFPGIWTWDGMAYRLIRHPFITRDQRIERLMNLPYEHDMYHWISKLI